MLALHLWPRPVKHFVLVAAILLVIVAYTTLCSGLLAIAMIFS